MFEVVFYLILSAIPGAVIAFFVWLFVSSRRQADSKAKLDYRMRTEPNFHPVAYFIDHVGATAIGFDNNRKMVCVMRNGKDFSMYFHEYGRFLSADIVINGISVTSTDPARRPRGKAAVEPDVPAEVHMVAINMVLVDPAFPLLKLVFLDTSGLVKISRHSEQYRKIAEQAEKCWAILQGIILQNTDYSQFVAEYAELEQDVDDEDGPTDADDDSFNEQDDDDEEESPDDYDADDDDDGMPGIKVSVRYYDHVPGQDPSERRRRNSS